MRSSHQGWKTRTFRTCFWVTCVALSTTAGFAQFESATLTGVVTDAATALVAGASVKAVNEATNLETTATTDNEGRFVFSSLRPGSYRVAVTATGFKQAVSSGVVLQVNQANDAG